jgi:hypothetical protein
MIRLPFSSCPRKASSCFAQVTVTSIKYDNKIRFFLTSSLYNLIDRALCSVRASLIVVVLFSKRLRLKIFVKCSFDDSCFFTLVDRYLNQNRYPLQTQTFCFTVDKSKHGQQNKAFLNKLHTTNYDFHTNLL